MTPGDVAIAAATAVVGAAGGLVSALLGIGGAVITTPAIRVLGAAPIFAVGSTVPAILPGAVSGSIRYAREGLVDWSLALGAGVSGSILAVVGSWTSDFVDARILMVLTALLMLWSGVTVVRGQRAGVGSNRSATAQPGEEEAPSRRRSLPALAAIGGLAGFVAGLLGVGGGIVLVPVMAGVLRVPMRRAVASSLVAVALFSVPTLISHAVLGHIDWFYALPLMVGVIPGARAGARLTVRHSDRTIRLAFGLLVIVLAVIYGVSELGALL